MLNDAELCNKRLFLALFGDDSTQLSSCLEGAIVGRGVEFFWGDSLYLMLDSNFVTRAVRSPKTPHVEH